MATDRLNDKAKRFTNQAFRRATMKASVSVTKFWETMLKDEKPELSIGNIDIYEINKMFILFYGYEPIKEKWEGIYGIIENNNKRLHDAVDMALALEFDRS